MGGYGALRFALKYPDMFAAAALLSPAIYDPVPPENSGARRVRCVRRAGVRCRGVEESELSGAVGRFSCEEDARADVHQLRRRR